MHGADAERWVEQRINALLREGEIEGAERFLVIADRLKLLQQPGGAQ